MLVYASCTTNSSVHESVISCTSPFSSRDGSSDVIEKCNKPGKMKQAEKLKQNQNNKQNKQSTNANLHKAQVQQQQTHNNSQKLKSKLQVMSNKVSKNSQDEGYNSEETNRNSRSTNSRPTSRESSSSAPDINQSDKKYNSLRQVQKQAIQQVQQTLKKKNHHYENHSVLRNTNGNPPSNTTTHYQNIKANVQLSVIHQNINSTVYKTTYNKHDCILKKISNTDSAQYELLQTKYLHKIMPEYTLPVYKTSHTKQHVFMLMPEYGVSLYDFMTGRGAALREFEIKEIYKKVGLALHKLHDTAGLSHLDIKEENILIDPDTLHPVLIDFATCRISVPPVHCQKIHTKMVGSPYFCAPEVVGCKSSKSRDSVGSNSPKSENSSGTGLSGNGFNDQFSRFGFEDNDLRNIRVKDYSKCDIYSFGVALFSSFTGDYGARGILHDFRP